MAEMAGIVDVDAAWEKFVGHHVSRGSLSCDFIAGEWRKWIPTARNIERSERDRERQRGKDSAAPLNAEGLDPNSFEASQRRKKRQREEDARLEPEDIARMAAVAAEAARKKLQPPPEPPCSK